MYYSKWLEEEEIKNKLTKINKEEEIDISGIPIISDKNNIYINNNDSCVLVIGDDKSNKLNNTLLPKIKTAIKANESIIVNTYSNEIYNNIKFELEEKHYNIIKINFMNPSQGDCWNPLTLPYKLYIEGNKDKSLDIIENIATTIVSEPIKRENSDPFWEISANNLFTGLVLYLFNNEKENKINIKGIFDLLEEIVNDLKSEKRKQFMSNLSEIEKIKLSGILLAPQETRESIISVLNQKLNKILGREQLNLMISKSSFDIKKINTEKTILFIINDDKEYNKQLTSTLIKQLYDSIELESERKKKINFVIDNLDELYPISKLSTILNNCYRKNISFISSVKNLNSLKNIYGKEEMELLKMSFYNNIIYLFSNDLDTVKEISNLCGNKSNNEKLINIEELKLLNTNEAIIIMQRMLPIKIKLAD